MIVLAFFFILLWYYCDVFCGFYDTVVAVHKSMPDNRCYGAEESDRKRLDNEFPEA